MNVFKLGFLVKIFFVFTAPFSLLAQMGPDVSVDMNGNELKWEEGARDYHVMFKSILLNLNQSPCMGQDCEPGQDKMGNPQADACMDPAIGSTYNLMSNHIPGDAHVEAAYLVWTTAVDVDKIDDLVDNKVTLTFNGLNSEIEYSEEIVGPEHRLNESDGFTYDGKKLEFPLLSGYGNPFKKCTTDQDCFDAIGTYSNCLPHNGENYCGLRQGAYTYRIDVTDYFENIHAMSAEAGVRDSGAQLLGNYTVTGMDCTSSDHYLNISGMIGGWSIIFVYTSEKINPKKVYIYDDLNIYQFQSTDINVAGFELPTDANVKITLHTLEGDPGLVGIGGPPEALKISGATQTDWVFLMNDCNPMSSDALGNPYTEIYNSVSSVYGWKDVFPTCVGNNADPNSLEYSMDVDTFILSATDPTFENHLQRGDTNLWVQVSANQDGIYTNYMVLSIDTRAPKFDIPNNDETPSGREKNFCSCSTDEDSFCAEGSLYFTIKVQNWGDNAAVDVKVKDVLPPTIDYVPGTTEIATQFDENGNGTDWLQIVDAGEGVFPLLETYKVSDLMEPCDQITMTCEDTILIRFKVKPKKNLAKHEVIVNMAEIIDSSGVIYKTNTSVPLRLKNDDSCEEGCSPSLAECGGDGSISENSDGEEIDSDSDDEGDSANTGDSGDSSDSGEEDESVGCSCSLVF